MGEETPITLRIEEILGADPAALAGKTIKSVTTTGTMPVLDRADTMYVFFTDGTLAQISYWASYAEDGSLELDVKPSASSAQEEGQSGS